MNKELLLKQAAERMSMSARGYHRTIKVARTIADLAGVEKIAGDHISEAIQFFHMDALSSMVGLKVDFDLQLTLMASSLYRLMARRIGREYERAQPKTIFRNLLDLSARVEIETARVIVTMDKRAHNPFLVASSLAQNPIPMPWFGNKQLVITFA